MAPSSRRRRPLRRARHLLVYAMVRALFVISRLLPEAFLIQLGRGVGALAWRLAAGVRHLAEEQLRERLGVEPDEARRIARAHFLHLGENLGEWLVMPRWRRRFDRIVEADPDAMAVVTERYLRGKGTIVATAHFGDFELYAQYLAWAGYTVNVISNAFISPELTAFQERWRRAAGVLTVYRGKSALIKAILRVFKRGEGLGTMVDIDTNAPSLFVPYFGELAKTPRTPADLALRTGAALFFGYSVRVAPGRHRVYMEPIEVERTDDREADAARITADMTRRLELAVRDHPEQWVWIHRRWKSRPEAGEA